MNQPASGSHVVAAAGHAQQWNDAAVLAPFLASTFPAGVVAAEYRGEADPGLLSSGEAARLGTVSPWLLRRFAAGRLCARRGLAELGHPDCLLPMNEDRRPQWPDGIVGSISHTSGVCGAVVARRDEFCSIGLDMEVVGRVTREIWRQICSPEEMAWLSVLREPQQGRCAALIFSAKESFYKCQYEVTREWLEFDDVVLDPCFSDVAAGRFTLRPRRRIRLLLASPMPWVGRFTFHDNLVVTGMTLAGDCKSFS